MDSQVSHPTPYQLRSLVLDYLCHNCYINTAKAFARNSSVRHLDADGDEIHNEALDGNPAELSDEFLKHVDLRERIRAYILSGRVDDATEILNEHFPLVLQGSGVTAKPVSPAPKEDSRKFLDGIEYVASTSVDPAHLTLNLRILSFIEACRTIPLETPSITGNSDTSTSPGAKVTAPVPQPGSLEQQLSLLSRAQKLHALANALPKASDRAVYLKELNNVGGLLAYKVPETSSMAKYLSQERREAVADQINSAILELLTRHTATVWSFAHQLGVKPRSGALLPPSPIQIEPSSKALDPDQEVVPPFDLRQFLDLKI